MLRKVDLGVDGLSTNHLCRVRADTTAAPTWWWTRWFSRHAGSQNVVRLEVQTENAFRLGYFETGHASDRTPRQHYQLDQLLNRSAGLGYVAASEYTKPLSLTTLFRPTDESLRWPHVVVPLTFEGRTFFAFDDGGDMMVVREIDRMRRKDLLPEHGQVVAI